MGKNLLIGITLCFVVLAGYLSSTLITNKENHGAAFPDIKTVYVAPYTSVGPEIDYKTCHTPIPLKDRVANYTKIQCVYSSIETIGRWAEENKLIEPPLTSRSDCKGYSGPGAAAERLKKYGVKFVQSYGDREAGRKLLDQAVRKEGRGALFDVPGHAMVIVHYDPENNDIRYIDNSDKTLKIQKFTKKQFESQWDSWVLVVYADKDVVPYKTGRGARLMPIIDRNNPQRKFPENYIPMPILD